MVPKPLAPVLMIQGTASGVGKSLLAAAFCRILNRRGWRVAPFKAQNMSNNAAVTIAGGEIGRAQALQAVAARVEPDVRMNPVLLKPLSDDRSEVVLLGRGRAEITALPWRARRPRIWTEVCGALESLRDEYDVIVAEGAGSPAETNLRDSDIVNMAIALETKATVLLAADIDRGGAFAALYGTWSLLAPEERALVRGFILNRFRGDASLLTPAPNDLALMTGIPTIGVVPYIRHLLPEEDGAPPLGAGNGEITIGVVALPHGSNLDDIDPLRAEPGVTLKVVRRLRDLFDLDALIIPGTRNTPGDLEWLESNGLADGIKGLARSGIPVVGLCGGYQMMGQRISDPDGIERSGDHEGLGILDLETVLATEKETSLASATILAGGHSFASLSGVRLAGYEIHHGETRPSAGSRAWLRIGQRDAGHAAGDSWGCYLHGLFENDDLRRTWLRSLGATPGAPSWQGRVDADLDQLANTVEETVDIPQLLDWIGLDRTGSPQVR